MFIHVFIGDRQVIESWFLQGFRGSDQTLPNVDTSFVTFSSQLASVSLFVKQNQ